jgi:hypothetical protein
MKITNFRLTERTGNNLLNYKFKGVVTVETGIFFKKKKDKIIYKGFGKYWRFVDTGEYTPGFLVETLQQKFEAEQMKGIETCKLNRTTTETE